MTGDQRVVVVGAGISGVACARALHAAGVAVQVCERGHVPGGRMASRRFDGRPADTGAAYFTADDPDFLAQVEQWRAAGLVRPWTDTFVAYGHSGRTEVPGPLRFAAPRGLRSLVEEQAAQLPVLLERPVRSVAPGPRVDGERVAAVVLAMPGPQAARLLDPALVAAAEAADAWRWSPVLAAVLRFPQRRWADFRGAFVNDHPVLALVCDDGDRRGDGAPVLVAHTTADFARRHLGQPDAAAGEIEAAVAELLGLTDAAEGRYVHRWTYARPDPAPVTDPAEQPAYHLGDDNVGLAGDAFGKPRVQTAWLSGHRLGLALAERLPPARSSLSR